MTIDGSLARSHSLTRLKRDPGTPKMNGGHHYSRFGLRNKESITNENKPPASTPGSPSSSSGHNSAITVAERRQTKVSKYLVSEDFKADFATKLNRLRQREKNMDSSEVMSQTAVDHDQSINEDDESQDTDNNNPSTDTTASTTTTTATAYTADDIVTSTDTTNLSQIPQTSSPGRYRAHADGEPIQDTEEDGYASSTSNQKEQPSSRRPSHLPGEEDPEEQSARYEVISKLADQLAEQIEENDSLLYELGVVRSNNARLQAVAADKEDEVACLNQRNRQLEYLITQFNSPQRADGPKDHRQSRELVRVLLSQLNQIRDNLRQLLAQDCLNRQSTAKSDLSEIKPAAHTLHLRRYSWSGARETWFQDYPRETSHKPACLETTKEHLKQISARALSSAAPFDQDAIAGWTGIVDQNDRESLKAHIHWLQTELMNSRSVRMATDAALQSVIESITGQTQSSNVEPSDTKVQGLGLFSSSTPARPLQPRDVNAGETSSHGGCQASIGLLSEEHQNTSSPLLALASFGFPSWGRKADSVSPPKQMGDDESGIPSSLNATLSLEQSPAATEKEAAYPFKRFGLRSFFNHSTGSPLSKPDVTLPPTPSGLSVVCPSSDPSRKMPNRSSTVAVMSSSQAASITIHENAPGDEELLPLEPIPPIVFHPKLTSEQITFPDSARHQISGDDLKDPFRHPDDRLTLDGAPAHTNPNVILI